MLERLLGNVAAIEAGSAGELLLAMPAISEPDDEPDALLLRWVEIYAEDTAGAITQVRSFLGTFASLAPPLAATELQLRAFPTT